MTAPVLVTPTKPEAIAMTAPVLVTRCMAGRRPASVGALNTISVLRLIKTGRSDGLSIRRVAGWMDRNGWIDLCG